MGVVHVVLAKFNSNVTEEIKEMIINDLVGLKEKIPEILYTSAGNNFSAKSKDYDFCLIVRVASKEHLDVYSNHPAHLDLLNKHHEYISDIVAVDYEG